MRLFRFALALPLVALTLFAACASPSPEPSAQTDTAQAEPAADVRFLEPADGDTVDAAFDVRMTVEGAMLAPAGTMQEGSGHFHILIGAPFVEPGVVIPSDAEHRHFGDASSETSLTLEPGDYTLRLQFADGTHTALDGEGYRDEIRIVVR